MPSPPDQRDAIRVGVIGSGRADAINPLMDRLGPRFRLSCIYEPVAVMAERVSEEAGVPATPSLTKLAARRGLQAAVVASAGGVHSVRADLCRVLLRKSLPVLWLPDPFAVDAAVWRELSDLAGSEGIVPAMTHRYTGATLRLRELVAGPLGPVGRIVVGGVDPTAPAGRAAIDWARWVSRPQVLPGDGSAELTLKSADGGQTLVRFDPSATVQYAVVGAGGTAEINDGTLRWRAAGGDDWTNVDLSDERDPLAVVADLFARRVIGGLIPVPSLRDVLTAQRPSDEAA